MLSGRVGGGGYFHIRVNIPSSLPHFSFRFGGVIGHPCIAALFIQFNYDSRSLIYIYICPFVPALSLLLNHPAAPSFFAPGRAVHSVLPHFLCIIDGVCLPVFHVPFIPSVSLLPSLCSIHFPSFPVTSPSLHHLFFYSSELSLSAHSRSCFSPSP